MNEKLLIEKLVANGCFLSNESEGKWKKAERINMMTIREEKRQRNWIGRPQTTGKMTECCLECSGENKKKVRFEHERIDFPWNFVCQTWLKNWLISSFAQLWKLAGLDAFLVGFEIQHPRQVRKNAKGGVKMTGKA